MPRLIIRSSEGQEEHTLQLYEEEVTIGRGASCSLRLPASSVSFQHAKLIVDAEEFFVVDLDSTNGTFLNKRSLTSGVRAALREGDQLEIGQYTLLFQDSNEGPEAQDPQALARQLAREALSKAGAGVPSLSVLNGPQSGIRVNLPENRSEILIGREEECDLCLLDSGTSRRHALLQSSLGGITITDLGSKHGTEVDTVRIFAGETKELHDRSEIVIGQTRLSFSDPEEAFLASLDSEEVKSEFLKTADIQEKIKIQKQFLLSTEGWEKLLLLSFGVFLLLAIVLFGFAFFQSSF